MTLFTNEQLEELKTNGLSENRCNDQYPVVKLFLPGSGCTWLLTQIDPFEPSLAFGLCDLGMGFPELGYVDLYELGSFKNKFGLSVVRDMYFEAKFPLSVYARAAYACEQITENMVTLAQYIAKKKNISKP